MTIDNHDLQCISPIFTVLWLWPILFHLNSVLEFTITATHRYANNFTYGKCTFWAGPSAQCVKIICSQPNTKDNWNCCCYCCCWISSFIFRFVPVDNKLLHCKPQTSLAFWLYVLLVLSPHYRQMFDIRFFACVSWAPAAFVCKHKNIIY